MSAPEEEQDISEQREDEASLDQLTTDLFWDAWDDKLNKESGWLFSSSNQVQEEVHLPSVGLQATAILNLEDYSEHVAQLDQHPNKLWRSAPIATFGKTQKMDFLHLDNKGSFTLTIIEPGILVEYKASIAWEEVEKVREHLKNMQNWNDTAVPGRWEWNETEFGGAYIFDVFVRLGNGRKLRW